ncbi:hypothetical protein AAG906_011134 [Vitis piasezkii]
MRDLPPTLRNRLSERLPLTHLSIYKKKPLPRGEQKLQDEYVMDSRIHSRPNPPWNFWNLPKHSRRGFIMIFSKITKCMSGNVHVRLREKGDGIKTLLYLTPIFNGTHRVDNHFDPRRGGDHSQEPKDRAKEAL